MTSPNSDGWQPISTIGEAGNFDHIAVGWWIKFPDIAPWFEVSADPETECAQFWCKLPAPPPFKPLPPPPVSEEKP